MMTGEVPPNPSPLTKQSFVAQARVQAKQHRKEVIHVYHRMRKEQQRKEQLEHELHKPTLKKLVNKIYLHARDYFSGEFGYPKQKDIKKFFIAVSKGDYNAARLYILKFSDFDKKQQKEKSVQSAPKVSPDSEAMILEELKITTSKRKEREPKHKDHQVLRPVDILSPLDNKSALSVACKVDDEAHFAIAKLLVSENVDIRSKDIYGRTCLHHCCISGATKVVDMILHNYKDVDLNAKDRKGMTPLMLAAKFGYDDIVDLLLEFGADTSLKDTVLRWSALHYAAGNGYLEVVKVLVKNRVDVMQKCRTKETAEEVAVSKGNPEVAIWLKEYRKHTVEKEKDYSLI